MVFVIKLVGSNSVRTRPLANTRTTQSLEVTNAEDESSVGRGFYVYLVRVKHRVRADIHGDSQLRGIA